MWCIATAREGSGLLHLWHYPAESCPEHVFISPCLFWEAPDFAGKTQVGGGGKGSHAVQHRRPAPTQAAPRPEFPKNPKCERQVAANRRPVTFGYVWGASAWAWGFHGGRATHQSWHDTTPKGIGWKTLLKEAFMVTLTPGAQFYTWHLPWVAKTIYTCLFERLLSNWWTIIQKNCHHHKLGNFCL